MSEIMFFLLATGVKIAVIVGLVMGLMVPGMVYAERRVIALMQQRLGPNRVGPFGLLQPIADAIKLILKEDITPANADKILYFLAPGIIIFLSVCSLAVIPFGPDITLFGYTTGLYIADINIGILYILAISSMAVYGVVFAGWSSNSKYSLLGGLRSSAQMISYELSMGLGIVGLLMFSQSLSLKAIVDSQQALPYIILQPLGFIIFFVCMLAETNRAPFDLPEAETELVAGFHTEYSSMKFAMFFMGEYANMVTMSAIISTLFLGGWRWPVADPGPILGAIQLLSKILLFLFIYIWLRATFPRFRYDQLMNLGWKILLPLGLVNILITGVLLILIK